jgi:hypothetical protein
MKLLEVIRGQVFWKDELIAHIWDTQPLLPPQATEEELAILVQQYRAGGPVPLDFLHRFFFWVRGREREVPGYRPYGPALGCSYTQVYYLGQPVSLEQLEARGAPTLALAAHGLNSSQLLGLQVWRLFPQHGLQPRYKFKPVDDLYVVDSEILDRNGRTLYHTEDQELSPAMQAWLDDHTLEEVRQLDNWRLVHWKEWPEVPPSWDNVASWMRDDGRWGLFYAGSEPILVGPGSPGGGGPLAAAEKVAACGPPSS